MVPFCQKSHAGGRSAANRQRQGRIFGKPPGSRIHLHPTQASINTKPFCRTRCWPLDPAWGPAWHPESRSHWVSTRHIPPESQQDPQWPSRLTRSTRPGRQWRWSSARMRNTGRHAFAPARTAARSMRSGPTTLRRDAEDARAARCWRWGANGNPPGGTGRRASAAGSIFRHRRAAARSSAARRAGLPRNRPNGPARPAALRFASRGQCCPGEATPAGASAPGPVMSATSAARPAFAVGGHAGPPFDGKRSG
jgi:hypothetical protein